MSQPWGERTSAKTKEPVSVRVTQQFRERNNMTYELDCSGVPLVLRIFFPVETNGVDEWRIDAHTGRPLQGLAATARARSRAEALQIIARDWHHSSTVSNLDWAGIARAMSEVRAI